MHVFLHHCVETPGLALWKTKSKSTFVLENLAERKKILGPLRGNFFLGYMGNGKSAIVEHRLNRSTAGHGRPTYARTIVLINRSTRAHGRTNGS